MKTWTELVELGRSEQNDPLRRNVQGLDVGTKRLKRKFPWNMVDSLMPAPTATARGLIFKNVEFNSCVLSGAIFHQCEFVDCVFDQCVLRDAALFACRFSSTEFIKSDLRNCAVAEGCSFSEVLFSRVNFKKSGTSGGLYKDCEFLQCVLDNFCFRSAELERCKFSGPLREVEFVGVKDEHSGSFGGLLDIDFREASPCDIRIFNINPMRCSFADSPEIARHTRAQLIDMIRCLSNEQDVTSRVVRAALESTLRDMHPNQELSFLFLPILHRYDGAIELYSRISHHD